MDSHDNTPVKKVLFSLGTIVAMNIATVINIYGFPSEAFYGLTSVSLYAIALVVFLVPVALVSAEMGSMFPREGGVYTWVSNGLSHEMGVFATWLQWVQSVFFYPLSLTFAAVTFSYIIPDQEIAASISGNKYFVIAFILIVFWFCTFVAMKGLKHIGRVSRYGVVIGIIVPMVLLVALAAYYVISGGEIEMNTDVSAIIPRFHNVDQVVMAISIMLFFSGLEVNGVHVHMMKNPSREYPRALFLACLVISLIYTLGTLSVSVIIPAAQLNITQSVIVALKDYFTYAGLRILVPVIAAALCFGVVANTLGWISGPATAIKYIASLGYFPHVVKRQNKNGAPIVILLSQACVVTVLCLVYVISSQVQQGYQMLLQITNAIYLTMYVILFISFIRLRYKDKNTVRPFKAGKSRAMAWVIAMTGCIAATVSFVLCFFPPAQLNIHHHRKYIFILLVIYMALILPPILYAIVRKKRKN